MFKDTVLFTRQPEMRTGLLFDQNLVPAGSKAGIIPAKMTKELKAQIALKADKDAAIKAWTDKYGGYNSLAISHFALIKGLDKKIYKYRFIRIPMIKAGEISSNEEILAYCEKESGYKNVEIIRSKVLFNTLLSINGYLCTITGSANRGDKVTLESASPLLLDNATTAYVKKLEKFTRKQKDNRNLKVDSFDEISEEENINLYKLLLKKSNLYIYRNRPGQAIDIIRNGLALFEKLSVEDQVSVLNSLFQYLGMTNGVSNFKLIGGGSSNGSLTLTSSWDPSKKSIVIIDQSITGIYESRIDLK